MSVAYDLLHTIYGTPWRTAVGRPPFAICIDADAREKLRQEMHALNAFHQQELWRAQSEWRFSGVQIGTVRPR